MAHQQTPSTDVAFNTLPLEMNREIALRLDADIDVARFRRVCWGTNNAIDGDMLSYWRKVFRRKYALPKGATNEQLMQAYQQRCLYLRKGIDYDFFRGHKSREKAVMYILRDLIVQSFADGVPLDEEGKARCKNQDVLASFVLNSKLLLNDRRIPAPRRKEPSHVDPLLAALKLVCSHFLFEREDIAQHIFAIEQSQRFVYMPTQDAPLYKGPNRTEVNMEWFLHCLNFFRFHMVNEEIASLINTMADLAPGQKPSAWQGGLQKGACPLGKHWKGTYSFLDLPEIKKLRALSEEDVDQHHFIDKNVEEGKIQTLELEFIEGEPITWPKLFEDKLHSLQYTVPKAQSRRKHEDAAKETPPKNIQFVGTGIDLDDDFNCLGWLNALPDQQGIPGWQRITFMKHFLDDFDQPGDDNLWAYEGVVLPGGRIILGRWWFASSEFHADRDYNGPFILWATDEPDIVEDAVVEGEEEE